MKAPQVGMNAQFFETAIARPKPAIVTEVHPTSVSLVIFLNGYWVERVAVRFLPEPEEMNSGEPFVCLIPEAYGITGFPSPSIIDRAIERCDEHQLAIKTECAAQAIDNLSPMNKMTFEYEISERRRKNIGLRTALETTLVGLQAQIDELTKEIDK